MPAHTSDHMKTYLKTVAPGLTSAETNVGALLKAWRAANSLQTDAAYDAFLAGVLSGGAQPARATRNDREYFAFKFLSGLP